MWFGVLGSLSVVDAGGEPVQVAAARQRILLAALLLNANRAISYDELCETVWDGVPTPGAVATLRSYMMRLRRALGPSAAARIAVHASSYRLRVDETELDVSRFEQLCASADTALRARDWGRASAIASQALELWRATPLLDVESRVLRERWVPRLENAHLALVENRIEAELRLGRHHRLVPELRLLTAQHPLQENFHAQLIRALAGSGMRAEALAAYQAARRVVVDELGIEPGPELRRVHERILAGAADDGDELRYGFRGQLRAYAVERVAEQKADAERREAVRRLLDRHLHTATAALAVLHPEQPAACPEKPADDVTPEAFPDTETARAWFDAEYPTLAGTVAQACDAGFDGHAWRILGSWTWYLAGRGSSGDLTSLSRTVLAAAERAGERLGQAFAHQWLGDALAWRGPDPDALGQFRRALALHETLGERGRHADTHRAISALLQRCDDCAAALAHQHQALDVFRAEANAAGQARALNGIGWCHAMLQDYERALTYCRQALDLATRLDDADISAAALDSLGYALRQLGHHKPVVACLERAIRLWEATGQRYYTAAALIHLGDTHDTLGDTTAAQKAWHQALAILDELGHPDAARLRVKLRPAH